MLGGTVDKDLPASTGDMCPIPGPRKIRHDVGYNGSQVCALEPLCFETREPTATGKLHTAGGVPHSQPQKAHVQQKRPIVAIK